MAGNIPVGGMETDITLNGTQPVRTLKELRQAVTNATSAWKAQRAELSSVGKSTEAAKAKFDGLKATIDKQKEYISGLTREQKNLVDAQKNVDRSTEAGKQQYAKYGEQIAKSEGQIKRAETRLTSLTGQQTKAKDSLRYYETGLASLQKEYKSITEVSKSYISRLKAEHNEFQASQVKMAEYRKSYDNLSKQLVRQEAELKRVGVESGKTSDAYRKQEVRVNKTGLSLAELKNKQKDVRAEFNKFHPTGIAVADKAITKLKINSNKLGESLKSSFEKAKVASAALATGIAGVGAFALKGAKEAGSLQKTLTENTNLLVTSGEKTKDVTKEVAEMQKDGRRYSIQYAESQQNIAEGYQELIKRGYDGRQSLGAMKSILQASKASGDSFADTMQVTTSVLEAFGMRTSSTAGMLRNTRIVANKLAMAADATATDFKSLGIGMNYVGTSAKTAGRSLTDTASAMGVLSNAGLEAQQAGTGLRKILISLQTPSKSGANALEKYGMSVADFKDKAGKLKPISEIFKEISDHVPKADRSNFFHNVFGTTGQNAAAILASNTKELERVNKQVAGAYKNDYVGKLANKNMKATKNQEKQFHEAIEAVRIDIGTAMMPALSKASTAMVKVFNKKSTMDDLNKIAKGIGNVANKAADLIEWLGKGNHIEVVTNIGKKMLEAFAGYKLLKGIVSVKRTLSDLFAGTLIGKKNQEEYNATLIETNALLKNNIAAQEILNKAENGGSTTASLGKSTIENVGKKDAEKYVAGVSKNILNSKGKVKFSALFKYGTQVAKDAGTGAGLSWIRKLAGKIGDAKIIGKSKWMRLFRPATTAAEEVGTASGKGLIGKLLPITVKGFGKLAIFATAAFDAIDIFRGLTSKKAKSVQHAKGQSVGAAIGGGLGAAISSIVPGIGTAAGATLGASLGKAFVDFAPKIWSSLRHGSDSFVRWWNHSLIPSLKSGWDKFTAGLNKSVQGLISGFTNGHKAANSSSWWAQLGAAWNNVGTSKKDQEKAKKGLQKGWNNFWGGMGNWLNGDYNVSKKKSKKSSKLSATDEKVMASAMDVSKRSISNVKSMSKALKSYAANLGKVKSTIKKNDPSKELNSVSSSLSKHEKTWSKLSKDIKPIGDAFKYLATFAKSMAKVDAFKELTKDLPKLEKSLSKSKKGIISGLKDLNKAFGGKSNGIYSKVKDVAKQFDNLDTTIFHLNKKLDDTTKDFKEIGKVSKQFNNKKNNPFANMATGLDKFKKVLKSDTKTITKYVKSLSKAFNDTTVKGKKQNGLISDFKAINKPLDSVDKSIVSLSKHIKPVTNGFQAIAKAASQFSKKGVTAKNNAFTKMADGINALYKELKSHAGSISKNMLKVSQSMGVSVGSDSKSAKDKKGSKKSETISYSTVAKSFKTINSEFSKLDKNSKSLVKNFNKLKNPIKKLDSSIKKLSKTLKKDKFGEQIAKQIKKANDAFKKQGKKNFVTELETAFKKLEKSLKSFKKKYKKDWSDLWDDAPKDLAKSMKKSGENQDDGFKKLIKNFESSAKKYNTHFNSWLKYLEKDFKKVFESLIPGYVKTGMSKMINTINNATSGVNKVISSFGGNSNVISKIHLATGTGYFGNQRREITKPTLAVLNDGHDSPETGNRETIYRPSTGQLGIVQGVNVPTLLNPGDEVFNASESKMLGLTHFATGTGYLKQLYEQAKSYNKNPTNTLDKIFNFTDSSRKALKSLIDGSLKKIGNQAVDWWGQLWKMVNDKINDGNASGLLKAVEKYGEGHKYVWGAYGPTTFDCSGLVLYALKKAYGISYPHFSGAQYDRTQHISKAQAKSGDLVFWGSGGSDHVGVYAGGNKYFSAQSPSQGIHMNTLDSVVGKGSPKFGRVKGLKQDDDSDKVKADTGLAKKIKNKVGKGFWKTISKIADEFGTSSTGIAGKPSGDHSHWMEQAGIPKKDWDNINYIVTAESGWNPRATNGNHWGMGQMSAENMHYYSDHGNKWNPIAQLMGIMDYIKDRYGSVEKAVAFRKAHNWYANGGIANQPSIFGEAGPEMAVPLVPTKATRAWELIGKAIGILSAQSDFGNQPVVDSKEKKEEKDFRQAVLLLLERLVNKDNSANITLTTPEGRTLWSVVEPFYKENERANQIKQRRGLSGGF
ncbi:MULTISPECIES: phage tail tape measure protein [unclassified Lactobacillus]|uniref:phage tail tape measure protein n=1 Tax=unclassified Lactobacillus TaxID=2620435 RepID=UPI002269E5E6|nr:MULTISPECIES: phage tail tape measure protein [unclassified Lactobacillus]MCX8721282.1 phage tail tape measure protein [Lactobacillus sp. B4010]MCX8733437.1 phage tail tape measure protein [Lactobacillus sp. B4015]MCX8735655.1 phage tail tape measure protein [Lactobacillus sp. B4012]